MTAEFNAGGCERCGKHDHVTYHSWQFLCAECRAVLADEQVRDHDHAVLLAGVLAGGGRSPGMTHSAAGAPAPG